MREDEEERGPKDPAGGNSGSEGGIGPCAETKLVYDSLDRVDDTLHFSANDVLALVAQPEVALRWGVLDAGPTLPQGNATLHIRVESLGDGVSVFRCDDPNYPVEYIGPPRMEIPVALTLRTDDGVLDERFETTLIASNSTQAAIDLTVEAHEISGSLGAEVASFYTGGTRDLMLELRFSAAGATGWIGGPFSPHASRPCAYTAYATWPADAQCWPTAQVSLDHDDALADVVARVSHSYQLQRSDGSTGTASLEVTLADSPACRESSSLEKRVSIHLISEAPELDLTLPGYILASPAQNAGDPLDFELSGSVALGALELAAATGIARENVTAAIASMYVGTGAAVDDPPLGGRMRLMAIDRTGFASALPEVELPGGDSERCFDARSAPRMLMQGSLASE